jgi:prepilin-type N-terminal cleavage/methylation domain-containing protein
LHTDLNGEPARLPVFRERTGFTLVELIVVMVILVSVISCSGLVASSVIPQKGTEKSVIRETEHFERWLNNTFHKACLYRRSFNFKSLPCSTPSRYISIYWNDTNETETYDTGGKCYFTVRGSKVNTSVYTSQWQTVSPAFTLKAVRDPDHTSAVRFVRISVYSHVAVTEDPPVYD